MTLRSAQTIAFYDGQELLVGGLHELLGVCVLQDASARFKAEARRAEDWGALASGLEIVRVGLWLEPDVVVDVVELTGDHAGFLVEIDHANAPAVSAGSIRVFVDRVFACPSERCCRVLHLGDRLDPAGGG